jgi:hypothetical protein
MHVKEPEQLKRGKRFHKIVQVDIGGNTEDASVQCEAPIELILKQGSRKKSGRADILISDLGDIQAVLEIKATDWDRIKPGNVKKNLWRHQNQLYSYIEKFLEIDKQSLSAYIIYPTRPHSAELCKVIDDYLESYGMLAHWYDEIAVVAD